MDDATRKDLDETRRLLYGALVAHRTKRWELVGTLVNALLHHSRLEIVDADTVVDNLVDLVEGGKVSPWAMMVIDDITDRLEAPRPPAVVL